MRGCMLGWWHDTEVYAAAKAKHPERWSGDTRNWTPVGAVTLNPGKPVREKVRDTA